MAKAKASPGLVGRDLVREVVPSEPRDWSERLSSWAQPARASPSRAEQSAKRRHVVALDYGMKWNIARHLCELGCRVTVLPGTVTAAEVLEHKPDGVFLSNGPGDPEPLDYAIDTIRGLLGKTPIFGICLGHQLLSLACGAKTFKLKFGHRGANQPVQNLQTGRVEITSQNHGFAVAEENLPRDAGSDAPQSERSARSKACGIASCRPTACSIIPRRRPARTTATICSTTFREDDRRASRRGAIDSNSTHSTSIGRDGPLGATRVVVEALGANR